MKKIAVLWFVLLQSTPTFADTKIDLNQMLFLPNLVLQMEQVDLKAPVWKKMNVKGIIFNKEHDYTVEKTSDDALVISDHKSKIITNITKTKKSIVASPNEGFGFIAKFDSTGNYHIRGNLGSGCENANYDVKRILNGIEIKGFSSCIDHFDSYTFVHTKDGIEINPSDLKLFAKYKIENNNNTLKISGSTWIDDFNMNFTVQYFQ